MTTKRFTLAMFTIITLTFLGVIGLWSSSDLINAHLSSKIQTLNVEDGDLASSDLPDNFTQVVQQTDDNKPINVLVLGSDSREGENSSYGDPQILTGARSDTTMLLHLSGDRKNATIVSIPRDVIVPIPQCGDDINDRVPSVETPTGEFYSSVLTSSNPGTEVTFDRFNQAYNIGGASCVIKTLNQLTGVPISHVVEVDFNGFEEMVNTVGGITVCLTEPVEDKDAEISLPAGEYKVNGEDALGLARARYTIGDGSDTMRIQRQQILVKTLIAEMKSAGTLANPKKVYDIATASLSSLKTDEELSSVTALTSLALKAKDVPIENIEFISLPTKENTDGVTLLLNYNEAKDVFNSIIQDTPMSTYQERSANTGTGAAPAEETQNPDTTTEPATGETTTQLEGAGTSAPGNGCVLVEPFN